MGLGWRVPHPGETLGAGRSGVAHVFADHAARSDSDDNQTTRGDAVAKVTFFEPPPVRKFDPNFQADTETYEGAQIFLARIELKKDLPVGEVTIGFQPRYQTCSGTQCIPPRTADVDAVLKIVPELRSAPGCDNSSGLYRSKTRSRVPSGLRRPGRSGSACRQRHALLPRPGIWRRTSRDLHAMRFPDDSDYDVVLYREAGWSLAGHRVLPRNYLSDHGARRGHNSRVRLRRRRAARLESVGQRFHRDHLLHLRPQSAGRVRDHDSLRDPDQNE